MNLLVINSSYRSGKTIDQLVEKTIDGIKSRRDVHVDHLKLRDMNIQYCTNCMACKKDKRSKEFAKCIINDDMSKSYGLLHEADLLVFASPINCGTVTAIMKTFLERTVWVFAKPGRWPIKGCPTPRSKKWKRAIIILSTGIVPPLLRRFCDDASSLITSNCNCSYGARIFGSLYAGAIEKRGVERYYLSAFKLGDKLANV